MLHITPWERTALQILAVGEGNEAIASRLRIGAHEVEAYLAGLFERLGAANRAEAVAAALRRGLLGSGLTTT